MKIFDDGSLNWVRDCVAKYEMAQINTNICPGDGGMANPTEKDFQHYWSDGKSALEIIFRAMLMAKKRDFKNILDFPCGYGRIARHLVTAFPDATLTACDIEEDMIAFCAKEFDCVPVISKDNFQELKFEKQFDLIWCGSLFTHLPEHKFRDCVELFSRSLSPYGIAIFTTHGRHSYRFGRDRYLPAARFAKVEAAYELSGFGYADYSDAPSRSLNNYGITLSSPAYVT